MDLQEIKSQLDRIERLSALAAKNVLNIDDVAILTGMSKGYIYQLTHKRIIPFYKPTGKQMYFDRSEIEAWMKRNRYDTNDEIDAQARARAASYIVRKSLEDKKPPMKTYIMYDKSANLYKIGRSRNIDDRLKDLRTGNPSIILIAYLDSDKETELHQRLALQRVENEWFEFGKRTLDNIIREFRFKKI